MSRPAVRRKTPLTELVDLERTLVHDEARGVYLLTARRRARQPSNEQIGVWKAYEAQRHDPAPIVTEIRESLLQRLARLRRRHAARAAAARAAITPTLNGVSS